MMLDHDLDSAPAGSVSHARAEAHTALAAAAEWSSRGQLALARADVHGALIAARCAGRSIDDALAALRGLAGVSR